MIKVFKNKNLFNKETIEIPDDIPLVVIKIRGSNLSVYNLSRKQMARVLQKETGMSYRASYRETKNQSFHIYAWYFVNIKSFGLKGFITPAG